MQATGAPPGPVLPGLLSKRGDRPDWVWAPRPLQDGGTHPPLGIFLLSLSGAWFWMHGAGDLLAAGQLEIEREEAGWDQQGPPAGATPGLVSLQEFSLVIF